MLKSSRDLCVLLVVRFLVVCLFSQVEEWSQSLIILNGKEFIKILRDSQHLMIALQNLLKVQSVHVDVHVYVRHSISIKQLILIMY